MEQAEHQLWRHLGLSVVTADEQGQISWPRVSASCDYHQPVRFEDVMDVAVVVERLGEKSVTYRIEFQQHDRPVATGHVTTVCCRIQHGERPVPIPIPDRLRGKLQSL
jgi:4-hydroxybenzoyl-CoA thioesterase/acyl-CoA thioester hydrolase